MSHGPKPFYERDERIERVWAAMSRRSEVKRMRSANFSPAEKETLVALVQKNLKTVENKKTGAVSQEAKAVCWERIAEEFHAHARSPDPRRSSSSLRKLWENLKKAARSGPAGGENPMMTRSPLLQLVGSLVGVTAKRNFNYVEIGDGLGDTDDLKIVVDEAESKVGSEEMRKQVPPSDESNWNRANFPELQSSRSHSPLFITLPSHSTPHSHLVIPVTTSEVQTSSSQVPVYSEPQACVVAEEDASIEPCASGTPSNEQEEESERTALWRGQQQDRLEHNHSPSPSKTGRRDSLCMVRRQAEFAAREEERKEELHVMQLMIMKEEMQWKRELHRERLREMRLKNKILIKELKTTASSSTVVGSASDERTG